MDNKTAYSLKSVDRAMKLLNSFSFERPEQSVSDLADAMGTHISTASRMADTLARWGILQRNPETGKYRLGTRLLNLAGLVVEHADLREVARLHLLQLRDLTKETTNLTCLDGDSVINIERISGMYNVTNVGWVGRRYALHPSATGKAILAFQPEAWVRELISKGLSRCTPKTICDENELLADLEQTRRRGYALSLEEFEIGLNAVAAPICNRHGQVDAALSISGPAFRLVPERLPELGRLLCQKARDVSLEIGCAPKYLKEYVA